MKLIICEITCMFVFFAFFKTTTIRVPRCPLQRPPTTASVLSHLSSMDVNTVRAEIEAMDARVRQSLKDNTLAQEKEDLGVQIVGSASHANYF